MSGGHFDYNQYRIDDISNEIDKLINENEYNYKIIQRFKIALKVLKLAASMTKRIDWLVSGDDGEESFLQRWEEEGLDG